MLRSCCCPRAALKWCRTSTAVRSTRFILDHVGYTALHRHERRRGIKTRATTQLPASQAVESRREGLSLQSDDPVYPTVVNGARLNMLKFENCVLLTRVGGFYELYFEHADIYGPQLNLKVAQKQTTAGPVSMAGFPFFQLDRFLKILVQDLHQYVAIAEEFPNDAVSKVKAGGLLFDRRVARVITPGTLIDENFIDPYSNNYVLAICIQDSTSDAQLEINSSSLANDSGLTSRATSPPSREHPSIGLAWLDLSTGQFTAQITDAAMIAAVVSRISPREIIVNQELKHLSEDHPLHSILNDDQQLVTYITETSREVLVPPAANHIQTLCEEPDMIFSQQEMSAAELVLQYVETRLQKHSPKLQPLKRYLSQDTMIIDKSTMKALEIKATMKDGNHKGTLLHSIRRTVTKGGARLLDEWLSAPSTSMDVINARLDLVEYMLSDPITAEQIIALLKRCHDSKRLVQKFALSRGNADDLVSLANTIHATEQLKHVLSNATSHNSCIQSILTRLDTTAHASLAERIRSAIDEVGLVQKHQAEDAEAGTLAELATQVATTTGTAADLAGVTQKSKRKTTSIREHYANDGDIWVMRPSASENLMSLHEQLQELGKKEERLTVELQQRLNVSTLSLRWTPGLGHICHVRLKAKERMNTGEVTSVSSTKSTQSFHHPAWTALGKEIDQVKLRIRSEEHAVFLALREAVILNLVTLRANATVLDELDIACSFATLAAEQDLIRPILNNSTAHEIIGGRHPTVQTSLTSSGRTFTSNDCFVGSPSINETSTNENLWLITGPNMAGKSTFLRQNALITILAQTGSYVPASYCSIGIVDAIYSRVGSADSLSNNQSTFMVEMLETASILRKATPRSFVIMDEIGRGTTAEDGEAVAMASLWHLYFVNKCRTLFATHFHGLPKLCEEYGMHGVGYYCTDVTEDEGGGFSYDHKLRKGVNRQSHALKVARIAGVPEDAIRIAREVLQKQKDAV